MKLPSYRMNCPCDRCYGFIVDFLCLPVEEPLRNLVKCKNIPKVSHLLAKEFYRIFKKINPLEHYFVIRKALHSLHAINTKNNVSEECVRGMIKLEALIHLPYKDNIQHIIFILEENTIVLDPNIQLLWIANCLEHLWIHLEQIHSEHTGKTQVSYAGPPIGIPYQTPTTKIKIVVDDEIDSLYN